jgi:cell division protein FtsN
MNGAASSLVVNEAEDRQALVLESRQLTAVSLGAVLLVGLVAGIGYVAGRSVSAGQLATAPAPAIEAPAPAPPAVTVAPAPSPLPATVEPSYLDPEQARGQRFLQVCAVERGVAEVFLEVLARKGFTGRIAPGPDAKTFRVLVGPLTTTEIAETRSALERAGFTAFVRNY